jgi:hypothetical protein
MDAKMQAMLQKLLSNPSSVSAADLEDENIDDALAMKVESPDSEYEVPADVTDAAAQLGESSDEALAGIPGKKPQIDAQLAEMAGKLKGPSTAGVKVQKEALPVTTDEESQSLIADPGAPEDAKLDALRRVRAKYLGR